MVDAMLIGKCVRHSSSRMLEAVTKIAATTP
jgi:hypothetical protein